MLPAAAIAAGIARDEARSSMPARKKRSSTRSPVEGDIRGAHFRVAARGISSRLGGNVLRNLVEASPLLARVLSPSLPALGWEPIGAYLGLLEHASPYMPPEDLSRMVGRATIHATFARMFGANPASLPVETVVKAAPAFWGRYHTWSKLSLALSASRHTELILNYGGTRSAGVAAVPALCAMVGAQLGRVAELAGGKDAKVDHGMCM